MMVFAKLFRQLVFLSASFVFVCSASGIVIRTGDGSGNVVAPEDDPGFANVGLMGVGSGVYLGNRWVLTANHVGARSITFGDETFEHIPEESVRIQNPAGRNLTDTTDALLVRLKTEPDLPSLRLSCRPTRLGDHIMLIGHGRDRDPNLSAWNVSSGANGDIWTPTTNVPAADEAGFRTVGNRSQRWGIAPVTGSKGSVPTPNDGDVISITTTFDEYEEGGPIPGLANVPDLGRAVRGDSGGAAFFKNGEFWELVGVIHSVSPAKENQPGGVLTVLLGTSTFSANLLEYEEQIRSIAEFGPAPGDFNNDGLVDGQDIDQIYAAVNDRNHNCHYDFTDNGLVTQQDVFAMLDTVGTLLGDADVDGEVGFPDFLSLARSFGEDGHGWAGGDFDGNGTTDFIDFTVLSSSFGSRFEGSFATASQVASVPEPSGLQNSMFAALLLWAASRLLPHRCDGYVP